MDLNWGDVGAIPTVLVVGCFIAGFAIFAVLMVVSLIAGFIETWWEQRKWEDRKWDKDEGFNWPG